MPYERDVDIRVESQESNPSRKADGVLRNARATADGALFNADWLYAQLLDGRLFTVNVGTVTGPVSAQGTVATTTPDMHVQIPANVRILPVSLEVNIDLAIDDIDLEIVAGVSNGLDTTPTGGTGQTVRNRNLTHARSSDVTVQSDVTAITSMITGRKYFEFFRVNGTFGATPVAAQSEEGQAQRYRWSAAVDGPVAIDGAAELALMIGKSTFAYFATFTWVELPS